MLQSATDKQRHVNTSDRMWARLLSSTHQPNFLRYNKVIEEQREQNLANRAADADNDLFGLTASHSIAMAPQSRLKKGFSNGSSTRVCVPSIHIFILVSLFLDDFKFCNVQDENLNWSLTQYFIYTFVRNTMCENQESELV